MKTTLLLGLLAVLFLIACDDKEENDEVNFPLTLKAKELVLLQDVRVYTKAGEITDPEVVTRFLNQTPLFQEADTDKILAKNLNICFLSESRAVFHNFQEEDTDFKIDTLSVKRENDRFAFTYELVHAQDSVGNRLGDRWKVKSGIFPEVREVTYAVSWGNYRKMELYYACCKWVGYESFSLGGGISSTPQRLVLSPVSTYNPFQTVDFDELRERDTLAVKEYHLVFE